MPNPIRGLLGGLAAVFCSILIAAPAFAAGGGAAPPLPSTPITAPPMIVWHELAVKDGVIIRTSTEVPDWGIHVEIFAMGTGGTDDDGVTRSRVGAYEVNYRFDEFLTNYQLNTYNPINGQPTTYGLFRWGQIIVLPGQTATLIASTKPAPTPTPAPEPTITYPDGDVGQLLQDIVHQACLARDTYYAALNDGVVDNGSAWLWTYAHPGHYLGVVLQNGLEGIAPTWKDATAFDQHCRRGNNGDYFG